MQEVAGPPVLCVLPPTAPVLPPPPAPCPTPQSYYGGLLCCGWSPDGWYVAAGGEDDLVAVYGLEERGLVACGQGHSSWVAAVAFDPWCAAGLAGDGCGCLDVAAAPAPVEVELVLVWSPGGASGGGEAGGE